MLPTSFGLQAQEFSTILCSMAEALIVFCGPDMIPTWEPSVTISPGHDLSSAAAPEPIYCMPGTCPEYHWPAVYGLAVLSLNTLPLVPASFGLRNSSFYEHLIDKQVAFWLRGVETYLPICRFLPCHDTPCIRPNMFLGGSHNTCLSGRHE